MVLSFFRGGDDSHLEHIEHEISTMLGDCRHSFDVAMSALVTDADLAPIGEEVRSTDRRINGAEESVRRELIVHSAVRRGADIAMVLTSLLVVKKLERVGDQNKNIFDLADEGFHLSGAPDLAQINGYKNEVSSIIADAAPLMNAGDDDDVTVFEARAQALMDTLDGLINALMHSDEPARDAVPRAMLYRYLKRIVANISGVVTATHRPLDRSDVPDIDEQAGSFRAMLLAAYRDDAYNVVLILHILTMFVAFAPAAVHSLLGAQLAGDDPSVKRRFYELTSKNGRMVYAPALAIGGGIIGPVLIVMSDEVIEFSDRWISAAFVVWFLLLGVVYGMLLPGERAVAGGDDAAERKVQIAGQTTVVLLLIVLYLMVFQPALGQ